MAITIDYPDHSIHITSPTTDVTVQELLNAIRQEAASEVGIAHPQIADSSGKETLATGVTTAITLSLRVPWQLEPYAGNYTLTIKDGNLVTQRSDADVVRYVIGGPQIEILRSASATIVTTSSGSGLSTEEHDKLYGIDTKIGTPVASVSTDVASVKADTKLIKNLIV